MSGIAAVFDSAATGIQNEKILSAMLSKIKHRGDMEQIPEIRAFSYAVLGCRPLSSLEEEQGDLSQTGEQDTVVAMIDGAIYNYQNLRQELIVRGHQFLTSSHEELLVNSYREWQDSLVDHLDGTFAFIIYDSTTDTFLAARDYVGIKPLYFLQRADACFIASEMKALLMLGKEIRELQPGHVLTREGTHRYFSFTKQPVHGSESTLIATFKDLLFSAVKKQVQMEQPIGIVLSGGLDSSALLSIASRYHRDITAFTVGFRGAADIETAQRYCKDNSIPHQIIYLDIDDLIHDLPRVTYYGEAFEAIDVMVSCIATPAYRRAKEMGIKIMLCGDGSDELMAGFDFFKTHPDPDHLMLYRLSNIYRTDLRRIDRAGMRYGVETRLPFLDQAFMSFAYSLPMTMKLREGIDKWVLREALKEDLPDYIVRRPKLRMPDGTGLKYQLLNFARQQKIDIDPAILAQLHIDQADGAYFLAEYLKAGYPLPQDRYKKPGWDFAPHGYFDFVT